MAAPTTGNDYAGCKEHVTRTSGSLQSREVGTGRCAVHGGRMIYQRAVCQTQTVLADVRAERARQFAAYGTNSDLSDGTGPDVAWLGNLEDLAFNRVFPEADEIETHLRNEYEAHEARAGKPTWMHLVREEVAEVFAEKDPARLREELIQVAALAVSWIEKIDARRTPETSRPGSRVFSSAHHSDRQLGYQAYVLGEIAPVGASKSWREGWEQARADELGREGEF